MSTSNKWQAYWPFGPIQGRCLPYNYNLQHTLYKIEAMHIEGNHQGLPSIPNYICIVYALLLILTVSRSPSHCTDSCLLELDRLKSASCSEMYKLVDDTVNVVSLVVMLISGLFSWHSGYDNIRLILHSEPGGNIFQANVVFSLPYSICWWSSSKPAVSVPELKYSLNASSVIRKRERSLPLNKEHYERVSIRRKFESN